MENYSFFIGVAILCGIIVLLTFFSNPVKKIWGLAVNSTLGVACTFFVNKIGANWNFHIGINWLTIIISGLLGIPGMVLTIIFKVFM